MTSFSDRQRGFTVIEVVMVILILAIAVPPLLSMFAQNLTSSVDAEFYTKATLHAEDRMEEILADKRATSSGRGFEYILQAGRYVNDTPETGYLRSVTIDTVGRVLDGIRYAKIQVTVSNPKSATVVLNSWVTDHE